MKSLLSLAGGGSIAALWARLPFYVKAPVVVSVVMLAGAELVRDVNQALQSGPVTAGEGAKGTAQIVDPVQTRARMNAGQPVSGAERMITVQYEKEEAAAREQQVKTAATNSEEELAALNASGGKLTSTQKLRLLELEGKGSEVGIRKAEERTKTAEADALTQSEQQLLRKAARGIPLTMAENQKLQELHRARAEAGIKQAEETAAPAQARANKAGAELAESAIRSMMGNGGGFDTRRLQNNIWNGRF